MFSITVRIILVLVSVVLSVKFMMDDNSIPAFIAIAATGLLVSGYFRYGTVAYVFRLIRKEKFEEAEKALQQTPNPKWLVGQHRGFYFYAKGLIALAYERVEEGEENLLKALEIGVRTENNKALILAQLAEMELHRLNPDAAESYLIKAGAIRANEIVGAQIKSLDTELKAFRNTEDHI